ncbi:MAG: hypothetical protein JSS56_25140 [Proteobacteria bacterium]|nr:hypothetical protein [Pseudomonadota bacterium]
MAFDRTILVLLLGASLVAAHRADGQPICASIDPTGELAGIQGDFELTGDPDDPAGNMLLTSNTADSSAGVPTKQNVVVARLNGLTGQVIPGSLKVIATNFFGISAANGPEWFRSPQGNLGILFASPDGVTGLFRNSGPGTPWNAFNYDYTGAPANGAPPPLPNTSPGTYPSPPIEPPATQTIYPAYYGGCGSVCFANWQSGLQTDMQAALTPLGLTLTAAVPTTWNGYAYFTACGATDCGLYLGLIDGNGGVSNVTLLQPHIRAQAGYSQLAAYTHPITQRPIVFTSGPTAGTISVWGHNTPAAPLVPVATVLAPYGGSHFRADASTTQVVLNYLVKGGANAGSYTIAVNADAAGNLSVTPQNQISTQWDGSEFDWYPAAGKWGLVYRSAKGFMGCWVTP